MKKVLILEDMEETRNGLKSIVQEVDDRAEVYAVADEREAYAIAMEQSIDVFLVDIVLHPERREDASGMMFAQNIREVEKYLFTPIIIISSMFDPKYFAYSSIHCFQFIEKPFEREKVKRILKQALKYRTENNWNRMLFFRANGILEMIPIQEIICITSEGRKKVVMTKEEKIRIPFQPCEELMRLLDHENFVVCRRGTIVNIRYIHRVDMTNQYLHMRYMEEPLEIGSVKKREFVERIKKYAIEMKL